MPRAGSPFEAQQESLPVEAAVADLDEAQGPGIAALLGPFRPPPGFSHGPEFQALPPRPLPNRIRRGTYARRRRMMTRLLWGIALAAIFLGNTSACRQMSYYVLVLRVLPYLGYALVLGMLLWHATQRVRRGRFAYVIHGVPATARILAVGTELAHAEEHSGSLHLAALLEYQDPETRACHYKQVRSDRLASFGKPEAYSTPLIVGDYTTVVGLPPHFGETLQIYGFLGLDPERESVLRYGRPTLWSPSVAALALAVGGFASLFLFPSLIFAVSSFEKVGGSDRAWIVGSLTIAGVAGGIAALIASLRSTVGRRARNAATAGFCGCFFGALFGFFGANALNAAFDRSPPEYREIQALDYWQETWYPIFVRNYQIEIRFWPSGDRVKVPARVPLMKRFFQTGAGLAEIGQGAFGMKWVRQLHPAVLVEVNDDVDQADFYLDLTNGPGEMRQVPVRVIIELPDGSVRRPSESMLARVRRTAQNAE